MSIVSSEPQRRFWQQRAAQIVGRIADLEIEIDIALQSRVSIPVMVILAEVSDDLSAATAQIELARVKINRL